MVPAGGRRMTDRHGRTCENCIYYDGHDGECRHDPPVFHQNYRAGQWPCTHPQDWCGKFTPKN